MTTSIQPLLAYKNWADASATVTPSFSGGSWVAGLPLTNLSDRRLAKVARSTDATLANTQFDLDCGAQRGCRLFTIPKHTLSQVAQYRIRGSNTAGSFGSPVYDSGWTDVWPTIYPHGSLPAWDASFWTGKLSAEDASGYNIGLVHIAPQAYVARYWRFEFSDVANSAGYVQLHRLFVSDCWAPSLAFEVGAEIGWNTETTVTTNDGGVRTYNERPTYRTMALVFGNLPQDEAFVQAFEVSRRVGLSRQVFVVFDTADTVHMHRRAFLGTLDKLSPLQMPYDGGLYGKAAFLVKEEL